MVSRYRLPYTINVLLVCITDKVVAVRESIVKVLEPLVSMSEEVRLF